MIAEPLPEPIEEPIIEESSPDSNSDDSDTEETRERRRLTEIRRREPSDYTKCLDYRHLSGEARKNMIRAIELQYKNSSALIRRAVLLLLEFVGKTKLNIDHLVTCWVWAKCQYLLWIFALNFRIDFLLVYFTVFFFFLLLFILAGLSSIACGSVAVGAPSIGTHIGSHIVLTTIQSYCGHGMGKSHIGFGQRYRSKGHGNGHRQFQNKHFRSNPEL